VVERGEASKTEVFHVGDTNIRTILRSGGTVVLETTQFQGLFDLERLDRGRRSQFRPTTDLVKTYPPSVGQQITAKFERTEGERTSSLTIVLSTKKTDELYIGSCRYKVFVMDRSVGADDGSPVFFSTDYYSADLKLIIAKEFREGDGRTSLNKFDRIYPIKH